jgi:hypothetical protein
VKAHKVIRWGKIDSPIGLIVHLILEVNSDLVEASCNFMNSAGYVSTQ